MLKQCSPHDETVCERCPEESYMEDWNYAQNCRSCNKCKARKGLQFAWQCSSTKNSKCLCQPGMFCVMGFEDPYCSDCKKYMSCKVGYGVSVQGTPNNNVKCEQCPTGTFSNTVSYTDRCKPHTKMGSSYSQLISLKVTTPEQVHLLEKGEAISDQSQCSNDSETLTRTEGYSSRESISPLQSTLMLNNPTSALSEPMTLRTDTEPVTPPVSIPPQSSSQPTSPQIISPVTNNPHVNVNITLHIGNGSYGSSSFMPTDLKHEDILPFGEEDASFSIPQQEAGKQSLMSVQESANYSEEDSSI
ncbi:tumor necrosis factor receptor superfamily member 1B [Xenentodon cancila]